MFSKVLLVTALAAIFAQASPAVKREDGPACTFVVTPSNGTNPLGAGNQLTYGFLVRMSKSDYETSSGSTTSYSVPPSVSDNGDGTLTAIAGLSVSSLTSEEISTIITEQWPSTWVFGDESAWEDYDYFIESASC